MKAFFPSNRCRKLFSFRATSAFTLIELLICIAIIGTIIAVGVPSIGGLTGNATIAKDQRNAQNLSSVFSAARAAGNTASYADKAAAVSALVSPGITVNGVLFQVPNLSAGEQTGALGYLDALTATDGTGQLNYNKNGAVAGP